MSEKKTKLQELATEENRRAILRLLTEGKTVEEIGVILDFIAEGGKEKALAILEAALLPENFENLPAFDMETRMFSDEEFKKHLPLFKLSIDCKNEGFSGGEIGRMLSEDIISYAHLIQSEYIVDKERLDEFFTLLLNCKISTPVVFSEQQQEQLN
jgi:hypothetical protein